MSRRPEPLDPRLESAIRWARSQGVAVREWPDPEPVAGVVDQPVVYLVDEPASSPPPAARTDWVRHPVEADELLVRVELLVDRARAEGPVSVGVDPDGILRVDHQLVVLSDAQATLMATLVADLGELVPNDRLLARLWPDGTGRVAWLAKHLVVLRKKLADVPLEVLTVRDRGLVLQRRPPA